tara:strand:- start:3813 stop:4556 length:744 start_codon:yes stop_codon:yes gene_type:complete
MITGIYRGGLGNQLFQIATGYGLALTNNDEYKINPRQFKFCGQGHDIRKYLDNIYKNIDITDIVPTCVITERNIDNGYDSGTDVILDGFFQTSKHFIDYRAELQELFYIPPKNIYEPNTCIIHIRCGDFLQNPNMIVITPKYFKDATDLILSKCPQAKFNVISDSSEATIKKYLENIDYSIINGDEYSALDALVQSDYAIISNSSFSWWGTYLGRANSTIIPNIWFHNNDNKILNNIMRDDIIQIGV